MTNAKELIEAIMFKGGPKNLKAIELDIDKSKTKIINPANISGISSYHSFVLESELKCFEYYNIGDGKSISLSGIVKKHFFLWF